MAASPGLKYVSLHQQNGYGVSARRYLRALDDSGLPVTWTPMVHGRSWGLWFEPCSATHLDDDELGHLCNRALDYDTVLVHMMPEYFPRWREREPGKKLVGYTTWETDCLPDHWPALLNGMDLLLVPCEWNRAVFRAHGVRTPIEVVPHIVHPSPRPKGRPNSDACVFYSIEEWNTRKAPWRVIEAYCRAFAPDENVRLVLKTSRQDLTRPIRLRRWFRAGAAARRVLRRQRSHPPVEIIDRAVPETEIDSLHRRGACHVSLSHGEGWAIPSFDAGAFGNAVVYPRFGGPLAYLDDETAYLVAVRSEPVADRRGQTSYGASWSVADLDDAASQMRRVYERRDEARERGARLAERLRHRYSEEVVVETLLSAL